MHSQAFGVTTVTVDEIENNLRFPGQYYDAGMGTHYNYFRDYDPRVGRYLQSDPIGLAGGMNTYTYVLNNPVNAIDALGLCPCGNPADVVSDAVDNVGSTDWSYYKEKGRFPKNTNKCNLFVEDTLSDNGFNVPDMNGWFSYNGPTAGQWGDPSVDIPGYPVVTNPQPGDIIAIPHNYSDATGHVGIVTGSNTTASHSSVSDSIQNNDWGHRPGQSPVYRRCQCP